MKKKPEPQGQKLISTNPNAKRNFFIEDLIEAGIQLTGTEVKSLRDQTPNLKEAYVEVRSSGANNLEAFLVQCHIPHYSHGTSWNHEVDRKRKLLLHRQEINRLHSAVSKKGFSLIACRLYFKQGRVKLEIGLGKGKKQHDRRDDQKSKTAQREMDRALKRSK